MWISRTSTTLTIGRYSFSTSAYSHAKVNDLAFPTKRHPTPFEIFHFTPSTSLTAAIVKSRYYDLCRLYHPDMKPSSSSSSSSSGASTSTSTSIDTSKEFKAIVEAYDLLRSPSKRSIYLRSGYGWSGNNTSSNSNRSTRGNGGFNNPGYDFSRGNPMPRGGYKDRGPYPSAAYDTWTDPFNPHFRPEYNEGGPSTSSNTSTSGWSSVGNFSSKSNGFVFLSLLSLTLVITPLSFYSLVPPSSLLPSDSRYSDPNWGGLSNGRDGRHESAANALATARREARSGAGVRREALKRRVRQIEAEKAYDRALEVQSVERRRKGTGHLPLLPEEITTTTTPIVNSDRRRI